MNFKIFVSIHVNINKLNKTYVEFSSSTQFLEILDQLNLLIIENINVFIFMLHHEALLFQL
jgi:hypothetical protein